VVTNKVLPVITTAKEGQKMRKLLQAEQVTSWPVYAAIMVPRRRGEQQRDVHSFGSIATTARVHIHALLCQPRLMVAHKVLSQAEDGNNSANIAWRTQQSTIMQIRQAWHHRLSHRGKHLHIIAVVAAASCQRYNAPDGVDVVGLVGHHCAAADQARDALVVLDGEVLCDGAPKQRLAAASHVRQPLLVARLVLEAACVKNSTHQ
jgi:hypothetical protein